MIGLNVNHREVSEEEMFNYLTNRFRKTVYKFERQIGIKINAYNVYTSILSGEHSIKQTFFYYNSGYKIKDILDSAFISLGSVNNKLIMHRKSYKEVAEILIESMYDLYGRHLLTERTFVK